MIFLQWLSTVCPTVSDFPKSMSLTSFVVLHNILVSCCIFLKGYNDAIVLIVLFLWSFDVNWRLWVHLHPSLLHPSLQVYTPPGPHIWLQLTVLSSCGLFLGFRLTEPPCNDLSCLWVHTFNIVVWILVACVLAGYFKDYSRSCKCPPSRPQILPKQTSMHCLCAPFRFDIPQMWVGTLWYPFKFQHRSWVVELIYAAWTT